MKHEPMISLAQTGQGTMTRVHCTCEPSEPLADLFPARQITDYEVWQAHLRHVNRLLVNAEADRAIDVAPVTDTVSVLTAGAQLASTDEDGETQYQGRRLARD